MAKTAKKATVMEIARSAGNRPIYAFGYGEKQNVASPANYSSACGAHDIKSFFDPETKKPAILIAGAVHGQETEGVAALTNLITLLEKGCDLAGQENAGLIDVLKDVRLVLVPVANPDGRHRVAPASIVGMKNDDLRYWGQGTWKDGSLCKWPDCKKVHPIKGHVEFLGGYYNDDGINLMHDQFFKPMAKETQALIDLAIDEFADLILLLHGGSNSENDMLMTEYAPVEVNEALIDIAKRCDAVARKEALGFNIRKVPPAPRGSPPPSFNLASALHHAAGAIAAVFESNECIIDEPGVKYDHRQIIRSHMILFEESARYICLRRKKSQ